jgi:hypothetical protein
MENREKDYGWEPDVVEYLKAKGEIPDNYLACSCSDFLSWYETQLDKEEEEDG